MKYLHIAVLGSIVFLHTACGLKGESSDKNTSKNNSSEDATPANNSQKKSSDSSAIEKGTLLYTPEGEAVVYSPTTKRECAGVQDCPSVSDTFIQECVDHGFKIVLYSCCYKACTGKLR